MLGVIEYCTEEGGSGFITNATAPSQSTFDITQLSPVFDQEMGWLRNDNHPTGFTYYPDFEVPPALQPSMLSPADLSPTIGVAQVQGCGMGAVSPADFMAHYGRPEPDEDTCLQIACGAVPQSKAGAQLIADCANAGYTGVSSCLDPRCAPWADQIPGCRQPAPQSGPLKLVLTRAMLIAPMPSITQTAAEACGQPDPCGPATTTLGNCLLGLAIAAIAGAILFGGGK
jgi:hypothetical protein